MDGWDVHVMTFRFKLSQPKARHICYQFQGSLIAPMMPGQYETIENLIRDSDQLGEDDCSEGYWLSIEQGGFDEKTGETFWVSDPYYFPENLTFLYWKPGEPNGLIKEKCVSIVNGLLVDLDCERTKRCFICQIPTMSYFELRFDAVPDLETIDHLFTFTPRIKRNVLFLDGFIGSTLEWDHDRMTWTLKMDSADSFGKPTVATYQPKFQGDVPIGLREWTLQSTGKKMPLKLSGVR